MLLLALLPTLLLTLLREDTAGCSAAYTMVRPGAAPARIQLGAAPRTQPAAAGLSCVVGLHRVVLLMPTLMALGKLFGMAKTMPLLMGGNLHETET